MAGFLEGRWGGVLEGRLILDARVHEGRAREGEEGNQIPKMQFFEQKYAG